MPIKIYFRKHCQCSIFLSILYIWISGTELKAVIWLNQTAFISLFTLKSKSVFVLSNNYFFRKQLFCFFRSISLLRRNTRTYAGSDVKRDANWDPHVFAGMEAGTSRSMPGIRIREDMKKERQKTTKKRNNVEEKEDQEEVNCTA